MTDYNDGKWHGWNGGGCPVHPESVVEVRLASIGVGFDGQQKRARECNFCSTGLRSDLIAFRVVKPYVDPREGWIVPGQLYDSARQAKIAHPGVEPIRVREVKE
jgi:hypothetical protein